MNWPRMSLAPDPEPLDQWAAQVLGAWLYEWRHRAGASQTHVARLAGIDQGGLSRIERGLGRPSGYRLSRIIIVLDWLSGGGAPEGPFALSREPRPRVLGERVGPKPPAVMGSRSLLRADAWTDPREREGSYLAWLRNGGHPPDPPTEP